MKKARVLLGMSGGVDSSVSAILLLQEKYEVIGAFMKNWSDGEPGSPCTWREDRRDAMRVAAQLGIEFHTFDFEELYRKDVYNYMISEYREGRTPNPDIMCNKFMKFGYLLEKADELNCDFIATGHYAQVKKDEDGNAHLIAGKDLNKDQSYFLCQLNQDQLRRAIFPIGHLEKSEVRKIAMEHNLSVAEKKDSQGICFIGKVDMKDFLAQEIEEKVGDIVTKNGEKIGEHKGHQFYTIGQRSGLGIGGGIPYFVIEKDAEKNELIVAVGEDDPALYLKNLEATNLNVINKIPENKELKARIRYRQELQELESVEIDGSELKVAFKKAQKAIAPGQFIAIYDEDELLASATIETAF